MPRTMTVTYRPSDWVPDAPWVAVCSIAGTIGCFATRGEAVGLALRSGAGQLLSNDGRTTVWELQPWRR